MNPVTGNLDWFLMLFAVICFFLDGIAVSPVISGRSLRFFSFGFMFIALCFVV